MYYAGIDVHKKTISVMITDRVNNQSVPSYSMFLGAGFS